MSFKTQPNVTVSKQRKGTIALWPICRGVIYDTEKKPLDCAYKGDKAATVCRKGLLAKDEVVSGLSLSGRIQLIPGDHLAIPYLPVQFAVCDVRAMGN